MKRERQNTLTAFSLVVTVVMGQRMMGQTGNGQSSRQVPIFQVDPTWLKLPQNLALGQGSAVAVDKHDNVWILHRPRYVGRLYEKPAGKTPAPPVLEFDASGKFIQAWGGPGDGYEWPDQEHGIYVDDKDNVWIGGSARPALAGPGPGNLRSDNMLLKFTNKGKFVMQVGHRDQSTGNNDQRNLYSPTDVFYYSKTNEVFVSDGYINRRVIVFDADTGAFKRMWGAYGGSPTDPSPEDRPKFLFNDTEPGHRPRDDKGEGRGPDYFNIAHSVAVSRDDLVYVADRINNRVQVFTIEGKYLREVFIQRKSLGYGTAMDIAFSPDA